MDMSKLFNFLFASIILIGCVASASSVKKEMPAPMGQIVERATDEMLELARDSDQERIPAIYVVIISEPETVIAKPPEK
tara:strand:+ start:2136 stop:2372 length:237 start_codon:yes stop_codon:yes gene_type:complete